MVYFYILPYGNTMHKIIIRSIVYHWLVLFIGISIGFIANSEWVGYKYVIVERSIRNIFFPIEYNQDVENYIRNQGRLKLWSQLGCPQDLEIIDDLIKGEEFYWAICTYTDKNGKKIKAIESVRIRWKTWEYYYKIDEVLGKEKK